MADIKKSKGQPTKFSEKLMPKLAKMYKAGFTDVEVAEIIGIKEQTISNWKKKYPNFFASVKDWKLSADKAIEVSLRDRATGWTDSDGREYPPDPTSMIFWLKNRNPRAWRDKINVDATVKGDKDNPVSFNFVVSKK